MFVWWELGSSHLYIPKRLRATTDWRGGGYGPSGYLPASQYHQHAHDVTGQPSFPEQHGSYVPGPKSFQTAGYSQSTYPCTANTNHQPQYDAPAQCFQHAGSTGGQTCGQPGPAMGQHGCSAFQLRALPGCNPSYPGTPPVTAYQAARPGSPTRVTCAHAAMDRATGHQHSALLLTHEPASSVAVHHTQ